MQQRRISIAVQYPSLLSIEGSFAGVDYSASENFLLDPQPSSGWATATTGLGGDKHSAAYYILTKSTTVQAGIKNNANGYTADTMFVIGSP